MLHNNKYINTIKRLTIRVIKIVTTVFVVWFSIFWAENKSAFQNPNITINGASVLSEDNYINYLKRLGIDSTKIESKFILESLYNHPYVAAARISHRYPNAIIIDISERLPFAMLNKDPMVILDRECYVLPNIENINCYSNEGDKWMKSNVKLVDKELTIEFREPFLPRRGRINCSLNDNGKWRWFGTQFTIQKNTNASLHENKE